MHSQSPDRMSLHYYPHRFNQLFSRPTRQPIMKGITLLLQYHHLSQLNFLLKDSF